MVPIRTAPVRYDIFPLQGGLDIVTPLKLLAPGAARLAENFEIDINGGYRRIAGYERFDGRFAPSKAEVSQIVTEQVPSVVNGDIVQNQSGTVSAVVLFVKNRTIFVTKVVGVFTVGMQVYRNSTPIGVVSADGPEDFTSKERANAKRIASDIYRGDIGPVPGSGPIRGVAWLGGKVYAWRDNAAGTQMQIYSSSSSGWQLVPLGFELPYNTGTGAAIVAGDTVSNLSGTATGVVARVCIESGASWVGSSGRLILSSTTGTWANGDQIRVNSVQRATAAGAAAQITLAPGGRVETTLGYFGEGDLTAARLYGADGVNRGFEFDGTTYVPINVAGLTTAQNKPNHVAFHKNYLFFSFGNSVQNSAVGAPFVWNAILGSNEIAMIEPVTGLVSLPGASDSGALLITTKNNTSILYGVTPTQAGLATFDRGTGAEPFTLQTMVDTFMLDTRGVIALSSSDKYGNFDTATLTFPIRPFVAARVGLATASSLNRERSQYRVFYSDKSGIYLTVVNGQTRGSMPVKFNHSVLVTCEGEDGDGKAVSFFGSDNGFVYQFDSGITFDGEAISANLTLNFNTQGAPRLLKRYRRASLELYGEGLAELGVAYQFGYNSEDIEQPGYQRSETDLAGVYWDDFYWDNFIWDSSNLAPVEFDCNGTGENMAIAVATSSKLTSPFTINSATIHFSVRRGLR